MADAKLTVLCFAIGYNWVRVIGIYSHINVPHAGGSMAAIESSNRRLSSTEMNELLPNTVVNGKYQIVGKLGEGGMGSVYHAHHLALDEPCAIKIIRPELLHVQDYAQRFKSEALLARKLRHPNAVAVYDLDSTPDGVPFIVMELVEGRTLREILHEHGPLPLAHTVGIMRQVCSALSAAHALGIIHRDIKPANILLLLTKSRELEAKVADFGLAKLRREQQQRKEYTTMTGMIVATPEYMSPEQALGIKGSELDPRSDLYSLGVVLYEMLTGELPFSSETPMGMALHHLNSIPMPPREFKPELGIPECVSSVAIRAMQKRPEDRYQTAAQFSDALAAAECQQRIATTNVEAKPVQSIVMSPVTQPRAVDDTATAISPHSARTASPQETVSVPATVKTGSRRKWVFAGAGLCLVIAAVYGLFLFYAKARDHAIQQEVEAKLSSAHPPLMSNGNIQVQVKNAEVTLTGTVPSQGAAEQAKEVASNIAGVKSVASHLKVLPPDGPEVDRQRLEGLLSEAATALDNGNYATALARYQEASGIDPSNAEARQGIERTQKAQTIEKELLRNRLER